MQKRFVSWGAGSLTTDPSYDFEIQNCPGGTFTPRPQPRSSGEFSAHPSHSSLKDDHLTREMHSRLLPSVWDQIHDMKDRNVAEKVDRLLNYLLVHVQPEGLSFTPDGKVKIANQLIPSTNIIKILTSLISGKTYVNGEVSVLVILAYEPRMAMYIQKAKLKSCEMPAESNHIRAGEMYPPKSRGEDEPEPTTAFNSMLPQMGSAVDVKATLDKRAKHPLKRGNVSCPAMETHPQSNWCHFGMPADYLSKRVDRVSRRVKETDGDKSAKAAALNEGF